MSDLELTREKYRKVFSEESYNAQHHRITCEQFTQQAEKSFRGHCCEALEEMKGILLEKAENKKIIKQGFKGIEKYLFGEGTDNLKENGCVGHAFNVLWCSLHRQHFHVPAHVLLPADKCHWHASDTSVSITECRSIFDKIQEEKQLEVHLDCRLKELKELEAQLSDIRGDLQNICSSL